VRGLLHKDASFARTLKAKVSSVGNVIKQVERDAVFSWVTNELRLELQLKATTPLKAILMFDRVIALSQGVDSEMHPLLMSVCLSLVEKCEEKKRVTTKLHQDENG
jgi:hypothetical protein